MASFPSILTEEEEALQKKYAKLKKKVGQDSLLWYVFINYLAMFLMTRGMLTNPWLPSHYVIVYFWLFFFFTLNHSHLLFRKKPFLHWKSKVQLLRQIRVVWNGVRVFDLSLAFYLFCVVFIIMFLKQCSLKHFCEEYISKMLMILILFFFFHLHCSIVRSACCWHCNCNWTGKDANQVRCYQRH